MSLSARITRIVLVIPVLIVAAVALAACGSGNNSSGGNGYGASQSVAALAATSPTATAAAAATGPAASSGYGYGAASAATQTTSPAAAATSAPVATAAASAPNITAATAGSFGTILVDASGNALYHFDQDTPTRTACTGGCATLWPPLTVASGQPTAGAGVNGKLGLLARPDGAQQVTYNGAPLYRFSRDSAPGQVTGDGFGGLWHVARP
jgi:predicted lipoprotein with Yx(FWY)xxD motif